MKRSAIITILACLGSFFIVTVAGIILQRVTGWTDPMRLTTLLATIAVVATYTEART
jgi:hypothetical protein